jgi:hypothetical protein
MDPANKRDRYRRNRIMRMLEEAAGRGVRVTPTGSAWHIHGGGVDLLVSDLEHLAEADLHPAPPTAPARLYPAAPSTGG